MIAYVSTQKYMHVLQSFLQTWGKSLRRSVIQYDYESLFNVEALPAACYVFTDLDRINEETLERAAELAQRLASEGNPVLNRPGQTRDRFSLLDELWKTGVNPYRVFSVDELSDIRYPAFLRRRNDHDGPRTTLLANRESLQIVLDQALAAGVPAKDLMAVEFCAVRSSDGFVRKYAYFNFGGKLVPRHVVFDHDWVVKAPTRSSGRDVTAAQVEEELEFIHRELYRDEIAEVFRRARIDYGRLDFSIFEGRPVIWEINDNPIPMTVPEDVLPARAEVDQTCSRLLTEGFQYLLASAPSAKRAQDST